MNLFLLVSATFVSTWVHSIQPTYILDSSWIMIRYSGLARDYVRQLKHFGIPLHFHLPDMEPIEREEVCERVVNAIIFETLNFDQRWPPPIPTAVYDYDQLVYVSRNFYRRSSLSSLYKFLVAVKMGRKHVLIDAVPCAIDENAGNAWFLAAGFDEDSLLVLVKRKNYEYYEVMGHVEPSPVLDWRYSNEQLVLEMRFLSDLKDVAKTSNKRSVCSLNSTQRLRLCCAVFRMYQHQKDPEKLYAVNHVRGNYHNLLPVCAENARISFRSIDPADVGFEEPVSVDILPCPINQEWLSRDEFYVTIDPKVNRDAAVYVLEGRGAGTPSGRRRRRYRRVEATAAGDERRYFLGMRVKETLDSIHALYDRPNVHTGIVLIDLYGADQEEATEQSDVEEEVTTPEPKYAYLKGNREPDDKTYPDADEMYREALKHILRLFWSEKCHISEIKFQHNELRSLLDRRIADALDRANTLMGECADDILNIIRDNISSSERVAPIPQQTFDELANLFKDVRRHFEDAQPPESETEEMKIIQKESRLADEQLREGYGIVKEMIKNISAIQWPQT